MEDHTQLLHHGGTTALSVTVGVLCHPSLAATVLQLHKRTRVFIPSCVPGLPAPVSTVPLVCTPRRCSLWGSLGMQEPFQSDGSSLGTKQAFSQDWCPGTVGPSSARSCSCTGELERGCLSRESTTRLVPHSCPCKCVLCHPLCSSFCFGNSILSGGQFLICHSGLVSGKLA